MVFLPFHTKNKATPFSLYRSHHMPEYKYGLIIECRSKSEVNDYCRVFLFFLEKKATLDTILEKPSNWKHEKKICSRASSKKKLGPSFMKKTCTPKE